MHKELAMYIEILSKYSIAYSDHASYRSLSVEFRRLFLKLTSHEVAKRPDISRCFDHFYFLTLIVHDTGASSKSNEL